LNNWDSPHGNPPISHDYHQCAVYQATNSSNNRTCKYLDQNVKSLNKTSAANNSLCDFCELFYFYNNTNNWTSPKVNPSTVAAYDPTQCSNYGLRCAERATWDGRLWRNLPAFATQFCAQGDDERPQCRSFKAAWDLATSKGYTDSPGYDRSRKLLDNAGALVPNDGSSPLPADAGQILNPNRVQKMKWDVVNKIREHVVAGGFLFAQCFAPETFDMALWQRKIWLEQRTGNSATQNSAYADCLAFSGFAYKGFYNSGGPYGEYYSSINANNNNSFTLEDIYDPRCQNHGSTNPCCGSGHCDSFTKNLVKGPGDGVTILGKISSTVANYVKGNVGNGQFCFMGGHYHNNIQTKRLVLNNVLLGAISSKTIVGGDDTTYSGRQKSNYGCVDPDNVQGGGADDYRDRFMHGFDGPIQINDRITPEPGNKEGPTEQAVTYRVWGDQLASPGAIVIVPITDIGPEIAQNSSQNASAVCIYDLQGQDNPGGVYATSAYNFKSAVRIIGFAEFEIIPPASFTRVGGNIQSGDAGDLGYAQTGQVRGKFIRYIVRPGEIPAL